jgi:hypothetical protein
MSLRPARLALFFAVLSLPAVAAPPRENRHAARIRSTNVARPDLAEPEVQVAESAPVATAAAAAGSGVDLAGLLGMLTALAASYLYARGHRISLARQPVRPPSASLPSDPR